jgi:MFS family permease
MEWKRESVQDALQRLPIVLLGNALLRISGSAGQILVGLYVAELASQGKGFDAFLVGALGAVTFVAELACAMPMGVLADARTPRTLMIGGALLGAVATQLFGLSGWMAIFFLSRALEGVATAAASPSVLAHITGATEDNAMRRGKAMSYFELSVLGGFALGSVVGGEIWKILGVRSFGAVAAIYLLSAVLFAYGAVGEKPRSAPHALAGLGRALRNPFLLRLSPAWLCINALTGIWLGPTLTFLLRSPNNQGQFITGAFADKPERIGYAYLIYVLVFGLGVALWSVALGRFSRQFVLRVALCALFGACAGFYLLNHSQNWSSETRFIIVAGTCVCIMIESGFTPAALALLAETAGAQGGRGATMGVYSVLLAIGAGVGSIIAGSLGKWFAVDGLIYGTVAMAAVALATISLLPKDVASPNVEEAH